MSDIRCGYKVFTYDLRPPVQGGDPVWPGDVPHTLPAVRLDDGPDECGAGWNYCASASAALRIAGLWPTGRPSAAYAVEADDTAIERGDKRRAAGLTIVRRLDEPEVNAGIEGLARRAFGDGEDGAFMAREQIAWREALARPDRDPAAVEAGLARALEARELAWTPKRYDTAWDAWVARAAWAARGARDAWTAWTAWDARGARDALGAWDARDALCAWDAWDAFAARAARSALAVAYAARRSWIALPADLLTVGIRDAYRSGLAIAMPTARGELGWAMVDDDRAADVAGGAS